MQVNLLFGRFWLSGRLAHAAEQKTAVFPMTLVLYHNLISTYLTKRRTTDDGRRNE
ncbi:MAG: hypothetical protein KDE56_33660 [Anaerolineales bacterium]|nr:hypothetical protein [Anaerolineales bacterium]